MRRVACAALLLAAPVGAESLQSERIQVEQRLAAERLAISALRNKETSVLGVLDLLQRMRRDAEVRERAAKAQERQLKRQLQLADERERWTRAVHEALAQRLAPRLKAMYRLTRRNSLDVLLSAKDFASMMWRSRALTTVLDEDLALIRESHEVVLYSRAAKENLEALKSEAGERLLALEEESAFAERERLELNDMVDGLQADTSHRTRLVKELEAAEHRLTNLIEQMQKSAESAFGRLKGRLPSPCPGLVEVGYGKIVNPRFNTVTVQKGLDIRSGLGTPVKAIAEGKIVYASWLRGYGNILIIDHGSGFHTLYAHLLEIERQLGDEVQAGDVVGTVGDTGSLKGAYLYFELRQAGQAVDPADWLGQ